MGKNKRLKLNSSTKKTSRPTKLTRPSGVSKKPSSKQQPDPSKSKPTTPQKFHTAPTIPFSPSETILLIGEGDLSFACSLLTHHACKNITATVLESEKELREKYPHVEGNIKVLEEGGVRIKYGVDASRMRPWGEGGRKGGARTVMFNFPHVGGKSTDVNRQVRYNQELLVAFFKSALPFLSPLHGSSIIVTLFEGEPYTLWNIRDLARHSGLEVAQSFKFQAKAYPGYHHARTIGVVKARNGGEGGGWKGEDRPARSYVFVRKGEGVLVGPGKKKVESEDEDDEVEGLAELDEREELEGAEGGEVEGKMEEPDDGVENDDDEMVAEG